MSILPIIYSPDPLLKRKSKPVKNINDKIRKLMDDMLETMYGRNGIGLAAVQVGALKRILLIDLQRGSDRYKDIESGDPAPIFMINPEITHSSEETRTYEEGCLSFPGQFADVMRPKRVTVKYLDYYAKQHILECDELMATCVQHEIDHLNGITFVDHLSRIKRNLILKKIKKNQQVIEDSSKPHQPI